MSFDNELEIHGKIPINEGKAMNEIYESKDKQICPFLLIQPCIKFLGTRANGSIIYFKFSPLEKCQRLVNSFISKQAPLVQPKDLLDAVETFRDTVFANKAKVVKGSSVTSVQATLNKTEQSERRPTEATDTPIINN